MHDNICRRNKLKQILSRYCGTRVYVHTRITHEIIDINIEAKEASMGSTNKLRQNGTIYTQLDSETIDNTE